MHFLDIVDKALNGFFALMPRKKPSGQQKSIRVIAHRGAHNNKTACKENTMQAIALAIELGCWGVEIDIHTTADDQLVVIHDATLDRLWRVNKRVCELSLQSLKELVPEVPSLTEVINAFAKKIHLFIEVKHPFTGDAVLTQTLQSLEPEKDFHIICLEEPVLNRLSSFSLASRLLVADAHNTGQFCSLSLEKNYGGVLGHYLLLTSAKVHRLQQAGQAVGVGFVDSKRSLYREVNREISWLFTNNARQITQCIKTLAN